MSNVINFTGLKRDDDADLIEKAIEIVMAIPELRVFKGRDDISVHSSAEGISDAGSLEVTDVLITVGITTALGMGSHVIQISREDMLSRSVDENLLTIGLAIRNQTSRA